MMTIQSFQNEAKRRGHFVDNKDKAMANWWKTWGLGTWWKDRWAYKEYTLGKFCMRAGNVHARHGKYRHDEYFYDGESVSLYKFRKLLEASDEPEITPDEQAYIEEQHRLYVLHYTKMKANQDARAAAAEYRRRHPRHVRDHEVSPALWPSLDFSFA